MIREIQAKTLLSSCKTPDPWFGIKYTMNVYRGCEHQCIYCDSRSECYQIEDFNDVLVKVNALERLEDELPRKRVRGMVGTGSMSDPYTPAEATYRLVGRALEILARHRFPVHIITKSDMVLRDLDTLVEINTVRACVSFTITTTDDQLAAILEPFAPSPSHRLAALEALASRGIEAGVTMMPLVPYIEDNEANMRAILNRAKECGARYILAGFGMTMRDRQRDYYYRKLDEHFPGLRRTYERAYGESYSCPSPRAPRLEHIFRTFCEEHGIATRAEAYREAPAAKQLALL